MKHINIELEHTPTTVCTLLTNVDLFSMTKTRQELLVAEVMQHLQLERLNKIWKTFFNYADTFNVYH